MIDSIDRSILSFLQIDARISNAEIARKVDMAPSAVLSRIRKMESSGILLGYEARIQPSAVGSELLAFVLVETSEGAAETRAGHALADIPEVLEVHHIAGEDCYLTKVRTSGTKALGRLLRRKIGAVPGVVSTKTTIALDTFKETTCLPLREDRD